MKKHQCEAINCSSKKTVECSLYNDEKKDYDVEHLCWEHAKEQGYCPCCGTFISGSNEEFRHNGICDNCWDNNFAEPENEEEMYYDPYNDF